MSRKSLGFAVLVAALIAGWATSAVAWQMMPRGAYLIVPWLGPELLNQCSRQSYEADVFWMPSADQIVLLETRLQNYLKAYPNPYPYFSPLPLSKWHRQYIGFTKKNRKYIYGNFYLPDDYRRSYPLDIGYEGTPFGACEGGGNYWGVLFDAASKTVISVNVNSTGMSASENRFIPTPPPPLNAQIHKPLTTPAPQPLTHFVTNPGGGPG